MNISECFFNIKFTVSKTISKNNLLKMKLLGAIIAVAAASTAISNDEKKFCYCCLDGFQWYCCTACLLGGGSGGDGDDKTKVADALKNIQVI